MLTVVSKHVYAIVAWGKSHGYKSIKVENIKQVTTDFEMLGRKPFVKNILLEKKKMIGHEMGIFGYMGMASKWSFPITVHFRMSLRVIAQ
jgi:hypothetical protein